MTATTQKSTTVECGNCGAKNRVPAVANGIPRCGKCSTPLRWVVDVEDDEFHAVVDEASLPVLVDVWAPWCGPCRMVSPVLDRLAENRPGEVKVVRVNVDEAPSLAERYRALSIPTLVVLRDGEEVDRIVGADPRLADRIAPHLGAPST